MGDQDCMQGGRDRGGCRGRSSIGVRGLTGAGGGGVGSTSSDAHCHSAWTN